MEWVVVANRTDASFFRIRKGQKLELVKEIHNPMGRLRNKSLRHDQPGEGRSRYMKSAPHKLDGDKDPHEDAADQFARSLAKSLQLDLRKNHTLMLKIVAEARFMGKLRAHFKENRLADRVQWIEKDLKKVPQSKWPKIVGLQITT